MGGIVDGVMDTVGGLMGGGVEASSGVNNFSNTSGLGTTSFDAATGTSTTEMTPEMQALFSGGLSQANQFMDQVPGTGAQAQAMSEGFLTEAGGFDPFAAAEEQFTRLDAILEPGRTKSRTGAAAGLASTGRLGSSSGNDVQAQVEAQIEAQRQGLLGEQFTAAQGVQDSMINRGTNLGAFGLQQQAGKQALGTGALSNALNIDSQLQAQLGLGSQMTKTGAIEGQASGAEALLSGAAMAATAAFI